MAQWCFVWKTGGGGDLKVGSKLHQGTGFPHSGQSWLSVTAKHSTAGDPLTQSTTVQHTSMNSTNWKSEQPNDVEWTLQASSARLELKTDNFPNFPNFSPNFSQKLQGGKSLKNRDDWKNKFDFYLGWDVKRPGGFIKRRPNRCKTKRKSFFFLHIRTSPLLNIVGPNFQLCQFQSSQFIRGISKSWDLWDLVFTFGKIRIETKYLVNRKG